VVLIVPSIRKIRPTVPIFFLKIYNDPKNSSERVSIEDIAIRVILHEICHVLIDDMEDFIFFDDHGNATDLNGDVVDQSTIGVRSTTFLGTPDVNDPDMYGLVIYNELLINDIMGIQKYSRAQ